MKQSAYIVLLALLASCTVHYHFPAPSTAMAPEPASDEPASLVAHGSEHSARHATEDRSIRGIVVDTDGRPVRARIAAVGSEGGSYSLSTDDRGRFKIPTPFDEFVLHASTDAGLIAVAPVDRDADEVKIELTPGATLTIDLDGRATTRCAVFAQHVRAEDFTLRSGEAVRVVVPAGGVRVRLYEGDEVFAEQTFDVRVGESRAASFKIGS